MPRVLKPQKVEEWRHRNRGVKLDFFLDRNDNTFFFEYLQERVRKPSIVELRREAEALVDRTTALTWIPMITVSKLHPFAQDDGDFIGFTIDRKWIAEKLDGSWLQVSWDNYEREDREYWASGFYTGSRVQNFSLPYYGDHGIHDHESFYLPYTEELWAGLEDMLERIRLVKAKLEELLTTPAGLHRLATTAASHMLPAGFGTPALPGTVEVEIVNGDD